MLEILKKGSIDNYFDLYYQSGDITIKGVIEIGFLCNNKWRKN